MSVRSIVIYDDPQLRKTSQRVRRMTPKLRRLIDDMVETMYEENGIGLAAVQVGVPKRIIVVHLPQPDLENDENEEGESSVQEISPEDYQLYVVINPELVSTSSDVEEGIEGCLSVPGLVGEVSRHCAVTIKGLDRQGKPISLKAQGLLARVFQHEIDHCDGVLFIDHIDDMEKLWTVPEGEEEAAETTQRRPERGEASIG